MNKIISMDPHCFLTVIAPSGSGKTHLVAQLLRQHRQFFKPKFEQFVYFYKHFQPIYEELLLSLGQQKFHLCRGVDWSFLDKVTASNKPTLLIFDDVYQNVSDTKEFLDLAISGRHQNLHLLVLKHNLYQQSKHSKTIHLNVTQMLLLRNPRDDNQIDCLGRQLGCRELLLNSYKKQHKINLVICWLISTLVWTKICVYLPALYQSLQFFIATQTTTKWWNSMIPSQRLFTVKLFSSFKPVLKKHFILNCSDAIIKLFCNCVFNIKQGSIEHQNVKIQSLKKRMTLIEKLCSSKIRLVLKRGLLTGFETRTQSLATFEQFNSEIPETAMLWAAKQQRFVLVPADVYFAEARCDIVGLHSSSVLDPSEPEKIKLSQQKIRLEIIEEKSAESPLETTNKTTQVSILDRLKQLESNEKNGKSDSSVSVSNKIQAVIRKLIEIGLSSSK